MREKVRPDRNKPIMFYATEQEKEVIVNNAKREDMSISDYCRKVLTGKFREIKKTDCGE